MNNTIFIDGDFPTNTPCEYHCSPTCHPAQIGPMWVYGCAHKAWPQNRAGDFVPIVNCDGKLDKCEIALTQLKHLIAGKKRRIKNLERKIKEETEKLNEYGVFFDKIKGK